VFVLEGYDEEALISNRSRPGLNAPWSDFTDIKVREDATT